ELWDDVSKMTGAVQSAMRVLKTRVAALAPLPLWIPTPDNRRFNAAMHTLKGGVDRIVEQTRTSGAHERSFVAMIMDARDESAEQLQYEVIGMLQQGHDTIGESLAWAFYLLSLHPEIERKLHAEIERVLG